MELTQPHVLLLRAAFLPDERAIDAWRAWHPLIDWDGDTDPVTFRLLAQLQKNLKHRVGIHQLMNKFAGVARKNWFRNQQTLYQYEPLLAEFKNVDIVPGVDAAWAITLLNNEFQLDLDRPHRFFVEPNEALAAVAAAQKAGWKSDIDLSDRWMPGYLAWHRSILLHKESDLHVYLSWEEPRRENSREWMQMNPDFLPELPIYLPPKIECLLHYCVGFSEQPPMVKKTEEAQFSLVANLLLITKSIPNRIDGRLLEAKLAKAKVDPLVYQAFEIVNQLFPEQIDRPLVRLSDRATIGWRIDNHGEDGEKKNGFLRRFSRVWGGYRKNMPYDLNAWGRLMAFPGYLMARWQLASPEQLGPKVWRSLKHRF